MKTKSKRLAAAFGYVLLALAVVFTIGGGSVLAFTSLPHIEEIVSSMRAGRTGFIVLELVPEEGSGSIGYYIDGGEPCADWAERLSGIEGRDARSGYMTALFDGLTASGLMGDGDNTPLRLTSRYQESYPWDTTITPDTMELQLKNADGSDRHETAVGVRGVFSNTAGDYEAHYEYTPQFSGGSHVQVVDNLHSAVTAVMHNGYPVMAKVGTDVNDAATYGKFVHYVTDDNFVTTLEPVVSDDQLIFARAGTDGIYMTELRNERGEIETDEEGNPLYEGAPSTGFAYVFDNAGDLPDGFSGFWYNPRFEQFNDAATGGFPEEWPDSAPLFTRTDTGVYQYFATTTDDLLLDLSTQYYVLAKDADGAFATGAPSTSAPLAAADAPDRLIKATAALGWYAVSSEGGKYQEVGEGSGYFSSMLTHYEFVGLGKGHYSFAYDPAAPDAYNIQYDVVYCTGGFTNNDWFLKHVFDRSDPDLDGLGFIVNSVTPSELAAQPGMISSADLIVLSAGFSASDGGNRLEAYSVANDVTAALSQAILSAEAGGAPVIVDSALTSAGAPNLAALAQSLKTAAAASFTAQINKSYDGTADNSWGESEADAAGGFVGGSILFWDCASFHPLATPDFFAEITGAGQNGFKAVLKEISYENWLRARQGQTGEEHELPAKLTLSNLVRYIINYSGGRAVTPKTSIRVLELEPATDTQRLSSQTVSSWLDGSVEAANITVDTMSTYQFIGKLEDLNETYDLIYVGSDLDGLNVSRSGDSTVFNDSTMDGLVYFNIGDTFRATYGLAGLLNRDYTGGLRGYSLNYSGDGNLFRFSGNDLTELKRDELMDFAAAGYPVILADNLVIPSKQSIEVKASLAGELMDGGKVLLTASLESADPRYIAAMRECRWYRDGELILTGVSDSLMVSADPGTDYNYTARISVRDGDDDVPTNSVTVHRGSALEVTMGTERTQGKYVTHEYNLTFSIGKRSGWSGNYPISPRITNNGSLIYPSIRWQQWSGGQRSWVTAGNISDGVLYINTDNTTHYRYVATINGVEYPSGEFYFSRNGRKSSTTAESKTYQLGPTFDVDVTCTPGAGGAFTLSASLSGSDGPYDPDDFSFKWYENYSIPVGDGAEMTDVAGIQPSTYHCQVSHIGWTQYDDVTARSYSCTVSYGEISLSSSGGPGSGFFSAAEQVNSLHVDDSSCMYDALGNMLGSENVMSVSQIEDARAQLIKYLNLSKPRIVWTSERSYPVEYSFGGGSMASLTLSGDGHYYLEYGFSIENNTDATPAATTYDALLCIDLNSDGKYTTQSEEITDVVIRGPGGLLMTPDADGRYSLKADTDYTLSRQMPNGYAGIIPWKLSIVKNGEGDHIRASRQGYTRIAPLQEQVEPISILQINSSTNSGYSLNLQDQLIYSTTYRSDYYEATKHTSNGSQTRYYKGLFGKLIYQVEDFDIDITTISTDSISGASFRTYDGESHQLSDYDMLIIGFADMYGNLDRYTANAIVEYAKSGKAILFTHDTTSATNYDGDISGAYTTTSPWGYYFNTVLRDKVGLDRYGITSSDSVFHTQMQSGVDYHGLADDVRAADYTMAFKPGSGKAATVPETQGFTNYFLMTQNATRIGWPSQYLNTTSTAAYTSARRTNKVTQVNKGQITTYPYDVNTADFSGSIPSLMTVANTHEQYYQVNMNSDDIVVWFCLADGGDATGGYYMRNDVTNAYYIYSKGSITYSGMGHFAYGTDASSFYTGGKTVYENEAKLFVNTMIAAYRTVTESPTVSFMADSSGESGMDYFFLTSEYSDDGMSSGLLELDPSLLSGTDSTRVFFKISDPNLNTGKSIGLQFYYTSDMTVTDEEVSRQIAEKAGQRSLSSLTGGSSPTLHAVSATWYSADGNAPGAELKGGLVYYIYLPTEVLTALSGSDTMAVKLFVRINASIEDVVVEGCGVDSVELRKIGLFELS